MFILFLPAATLLVAVIVDRPAPAKPKFGAAQRYGQDDSLESVKALATRIYEHPTQFTSLFTGTWEWDVGGDPLGNLKVRVIAEDGAFQYEPGSRLSPGKWYVVVEDEMGSRRLKKPLVLDANTPTLNGLGYIPQFKLYYVRKNRAFMWVFEGGEMSPEICGEIDKQIYAPSGAHKLRDKDCDDTNPCVFPNQILIEN